MEKWTYLLLIYACLLIVAYAQDCKVRGKRCADHEQCCGGCCFYGQCIDTYRSCLSPFDVCHEHYCRGEENCVAYVPPQCPGCTPLAICMITED